MPRRSLRDLAPLPDDVWDQVYDFLFPYNYARRMLRRIIPTNQLFTILDQIFRHFMQQNYDDAGGARFPMQRRMRPHHWIEDTGVDYMAQIMIRAALPPRRVMYSNSHLRRVNGIVFTVLRRIVVLYLGLTPHQWQNFEFEMQNYIQRAIWRIAPYFVPFRRV